MDLSDDDGFDNYVPETIDPGPWLFFGTAIYASCCIIMIPILVTCKKRRQARLGKGGGPAVASASDIGELELTESRKPSFYENVELELRDDDMLVTFGERKERISIDGNYMPTMREVVNDHPFDAETQKIPDEGDGSVGNGSLGSLNKRRSQRDGGGSYSQVTWDADDERPVESYKQNTEIVSDANTNNETLNETQNKNCPSQNIHEAHHSSCLEKIFGVSLHGAYELIKDIVKPDKETRKIVKLGVPYTVSTVSEVLFWALTVLLISRYTDVHQLAAYVVTDLLIGASETVIKGFIETLETVCPHAIGAGNHKLAGQYVQIVMVLYTAFAVPIFGMWWFLMDDCLEWFELSEEAILIGTKYSRVVIFSYYVEGIFEAYEAIPDVTDREFYTKIFRVCQGLITFLTIWVSFAKVDGFDLYWVGVVRLCGATFFFVLFVIGSYWLGWFDLYWEGMTKTFALKNKSAIMYVSKMAIPLSLGTLFEYGEWEIMTVFAASMGQAEVAAWGIMESIWDLLEAAIEGFSEAGAVREALHLGKGNTHDAERAAWKSLFLVLILGISITIVYFLCGDSIAVWFTSDETLQDMIRAMIPIVGFGNVFQAFGSMAWCLLGGQGRYHHATIVSSVVTTMISIPLAAFFTYGLHFPLESLVAALVVGYSTISMCLAYLVLTTDWEYVSKKVIEENEDSDDDSSSSDVDSSGSDSSSSDDESSQDCEPVTDEPLFSTSDNSDSENKEPTDVEARRVQSSGKSVESAPSFCSSSDDDETLEEKVLLEEESLPEIESCNVQHSGESVEYAPSLVSPTVSVILGSNVSTTSSRCNGTSSSQDNWNKGGTQTSLQGDNNGVSVAQSIKSYNSGGDELSNGSQQRNIVVSSYVTTFEANESSTEDKNEDPVHMIDSITSMLECDQNSVLSKHSIDRTGESFQSKLRSDEHSVSSAQSSKAMIHSNDTDNRSNISQNSIRSRQSVGDETVKSSVIAIAKKQNQTSSEDEVDNPEHMIDSIKLALNGYQTSSSAKQSRDETNGSFQSRSQSDECSFTSAQSNLSHQVETIIEVGGDDLSTASSQSNFKVDMVECQNDEAANITRERSVSLSLSQSKDDDENNKCSFAGDGSSNSQKDIPAGSLSEHNTDHVDESDDPMHMIESINSILNEYHEDVSHKLT